MGELQAGVAAVNITPPVGGYQAGFGQREPTTGIHDDLHAKALVLKRDSVATAIVTTDLLSLDTGLTDTIRKLIRKQTGIRHVLLTASHTHSGPFIGPWHGDSSRRDLAYIDVLCRKIAGAVFMANRNVLPVSVRSGLGHAEIGVNRRLVDEDGEVRQGPTAQNPEGIVDPEVPILLLERLDGSPLALLFTYACHALAAWNPPLISADYPGYAQRLIERELGCTALFTQGAGANINPRGPHSAWSFGLAKACGEELGNAVLAALGNTREYGADPCLMVAARKLRIPVREEAFSRHIPALLRRRKKENAEWIKQGKFPFEIHVIRIGGCVLVGLESEPVVEIGLEIKDRVYARHNGIRQASIVGYASNSSYYLTVPRMFEEGGYEHEETLLAREASGLVIDTVVRMVDGMWTTD
jgi:neutral ceramidase